MNVRFENFRSKPAVFQFDENLIRDALQRHKDVASRVHVALAHDLEDPRGLQEADVIVTSNDVIKDPRFPRARLNEDIPNLRWIHLIGAGIDPVLPLSWLPPNVALTNNSGVHVRKVSEFAQMALLMLNAQLPRIAANQRAGRWEQVFTGTIDGKTLLVIGLGDMGTAFARQGKRLGLRVLGVRRRPEPHPDVDEVLTAAELHGVLPRADFVVVAIPLTPDTKKLIAARELDLLPPGAGFVNVGRAGVVDYNALRERLSDGRLSGAILDVFDPEPLPAESPLWATPNLIILPHVSSDDVSRYMSQTLDLVFENLERLLSGQELKNRVDPKLGY